MRKAVVIDAVRTPVGAHPQTRDTFATSVPRTSLPM